MSSVILAANLAGVVVFATLLRTSRAFLAGLIGFTLALTPVIVQAARPEIVPTDSWWYHLGRLAVILMLAGDVLLLGAVYILRDNPSPETADRERRLARVAGVVVMAGFAFASLLPGWFFFGEQAAVAVLMLLAVLGMLTRWGATPVGLAGAVGFGLLALDAVVHCLRRFSSGGELLLPADVRLGTVVLGELAVVGAFALASQDPSLPQRMPADTAPALGVGLLLLGVGAVLFLGLGYAIGEMHILKGLRGRAAILGALLPASGLYLMLLGAMRVTTGRAVWAVKDL
jgi:hypothetical protein